MNLLDDAIREHLELRRKHGASEEEIARKETDALGPVRRETPASPAAAGEETWLSSEETMVIPSPAAEAAPGPPDDLLVPQSSPQGDVEPEPSSAEPGPQLVEPASGGTDWFEQRGEGVGQGSSLDVVGPGGSRPLGPGEPLAPADVFPEPNPTVPDERLSADPPFIESGALVDDLPVGHTEPLEEPDSVVPLADPEPPAVEPDGPIEDPAALAEEPAAEPPVPTSDLPAEEHLGYEEDMPVEDIGAPLESLPVEEERLAAGEPPLREEGLFKDEPPALGVSELPLDPDESEWALEERGELEEFDAVPSVPDGDEHAAVGEPDDVLEDTPDFLQETPEHDRLWFEQRPPRDFDFDD